MSWLPIAQMQVSTSLLLFELYIKEKKKKSHYYLCILPVHTICVKTHNRRNHVSIKLWHSLKQSDPNRLKPCDEGQKQEQLPCLTRCYMLLNSQKRSRSGNSPSYCDISYSAFKGSKCSFRKSWFPLIGFQRPCDPRWNHKVQRALFYWKSSIFQKMPRY